MKKGLIFLAVILAYSCGFVVLQIPNLIVKGEGTNFVITDLGLNVNVGRKEETVRNTGDYKITVKNGKVDSTFTVHLTKETAVIIDVTSSELNMTTIDR